MPNAALVTLALGDKHQAVLERVLPSWRAYADRHGYALFPITEPLDPSPEAQARSPAWQKLLILEPEWAGGFERVVWLDADIVINAEKAPDLLAGLPPDKIGAVARDASKPAASAAALAPGVPGMVEALEFRNGQKPPHAADYYAAYGLDDPGDFVNTGVLALSPAHHRDLFRRLYRETFAKPDPLNQYEQPYLSHAIVSEGRLAPLDRRFNRLWFEEMCAHYPFLLCHDDTDRGWDSLVHLCVQSAFVNAYFLHFAGAIPFLGYWRADIAGWRDFARLFTPKSK
jgi:hypothetical protein